MSDHPLKVPKSVTFVQLGLALLPDTPEITGAIGNPTPSRVNAALKVIRDLRGEDAVQWHSLGTKSKTTTENIGTFFIARMGVGEGCYLLALSHYDPGVSKYDPDTQSHREMVCFLVHRLGAVAENMCNGREFESEDEAVAMKEAVEQQCASLGLFAELQQYTSTVSRVSVFREAKLTLYLFSSSSCSGD